MYKIHESPAGSLFSIYEPGEARERLQLDDVLVASDLDGTLKPSPAKAMVRAGLGNNSYTQNAEWIRYSARVVRDLARAGGSFQDIAAKVQSPIFFHWATHVWPTFSDEKKKAVLAAGNTSLFPGVKQTFYQLLADSPGIIVSRNLPEVVEPVAQELGFTAWYGLARDKSSVLLRHAAGNYDRFLLFGDTGEDFCVRDALARQGKHVDLVAVCTDPQKADPRATYAIGRDFTPLAEFLQM